jgi:hypothetical protein
MNENIAYRKVKCVQIKLILQIWAGTLKRWGTQRATNRKAPVSIPDDFTAIFHWLNPSGPHYGPWVNSDCNRNEYHGYILGGKGGRCVGLKTWPS